MVPGVNRLTQFARVSDESHGTPFAGDFFFCFHNGELDHEITADNATFVRWRRSPLCPLDAPAEVKA
jgi:hypothetical protein